LYAFGAGESTLKLYPPRADVLRDVDVVDDFLDRPQRPRLRLVEPLDAGDLGRGDAVEYSPFEDFVLPADQLRAGRGVAVAHGGQGVDHARLRIETDGEAVAFLAERDDQLA